MRILALIIQDLVFVLKEIIILYRIIFVQNIAMVRVLRCGEITIV